MLNALKVEYIGDPKEMIDIQCFESLPAHLQSVTKHFEHSVITETHDGLKYSLFIYFTGYS